MTLTPEARARLERYCKAYEDAPKGVPVGIKLPLAGDLRAALKELDLWYELVFELLWALDRAPEMREGEEPTSFVVRYGVWVTVSKRRVLRGPAYETFQAACAGSGCTPPPDGPRAAPEQPRADSAGPGRIPPVPAPEREEPRR